MTFTESTALVTVVSHIELAEAMANARTDRDLRLLAMAISRLHLGQPKNPAYRKLLDDLHDQLCPGPIGNHPILQSPTLRARFNAAASPKAPTPPQTPSSPAPSNPATTPPEAPTPTPTPTPAPTTEFTPASSTPTTPQPPSPPTSSPSPSAPSARSEPIATPARPTNPQLPSSLTTHAGTPTSASSPSAPTVQIRTPTRPTLPPPITPDALPKLPSDPLTPAEIAHFCFLSGVTNPAAFSRHTPRFWRLHARSLLRDAAIARAILPEHRPLLSAYETLLGRDGAPENALESLISPPRPAANHTRPPPAAESNV